MLLILNRHIYKNDIIIRKGTCNFPIKQNISAKIAQDTFFLALSEKNVNYYQNKLKELTIFAKILQKL